MAESEHDQMVENTRALVEKLNAVGWGLFFIWIGDSHPRRPVRAGDRNRLRRVGVWELLKIQLGEAPIPGGLLPILCIVVGIVLVVSALLRTPRHEKLGSLFGDG